MNRFFLVMCTCALVHAANAQPQERPVQSFEPRWLATQLQDTGANAVVLSLCGKELHSCVDAKELLRTNLAQCSKVVLGIIDVDKYPETPRNLYDAQDSKLIILMKPPGEKHLSPATLMATPNPDTYATALCPEESRAFGPALKALGNLGLPPEMLPSLIEPR